MEETGENLTFVEFLIDGKEEIKKFNKVFVGAGAIGTSKLMINSIYNLKQVEIKSNDLITIPYINFSKFNKKLYTFSDIFFNFKYREKKFLDKYTVYLKTFLRCQLMQFQLLQS